MADHTPSPPQDTFSTIAEGYGGAQQTLARLGFLPGATPGSFSPSDRNGTAVQFPTPPPPRFPTVVSTTLPFPSAVPQFAGAAAPPQPSVLPPMFSTPQPTFTQGMPSANFAPPQQSYSAAMPPQAAPFPFGVPTAASNWTRAFTQPMQGFGHPGSSFGAGSLFSDAVQSGYVSRPFFMEGSGTGVNTMQQRASAGLRMNQRFEDWGASAFNGASLGMSVIGGAAALGLGGATLGGIAAAGGMIAAPMLAASAWTDAYRDERAGTRAVQNVFSGMSMGPMMSPLGQGINPMSARQIQNRFKESTAGGDFTSGDMFSTMSMAQESGLMRGHTNSVEQVVTRVKELAKVTKSIMDLGQGITQQDAMDLQAISSNMGIGTAQFASQGIGKKLVTAARVTGQTVQDVMSGVGASGASMFAQAGMNAGSGMMVGIHTAGLSAGMVNSGVLSPRELSALGGESGIQNTMAQGIARFQAQNAGNMMRGMLTGENALHYMQTGSMSMKDAFDKGGRIFNDQNLSSKQRKLAAQFYDEAAPDMLSDMQSKMTPERMQAMQIAQANALMRDSKGTMIASTAFTKVAGSEEGGRVLMKLMEHPEILKAQAAQSAVVGREENNRLAASYDNHHGFIADLGRTARGASASLKDTFGIEEAATWAAKRDYEQEARAAGVDPSSYTHKYKNLVNNDTLVGDVTSGRKSFGDALRGEEAAAAPGRRRKFSDVDTSFASEALYNSGMRSTDDRYTSQAERGSMFASLTDASSGAFVMDEYKKYSEDPSKALAFMDDLNRPGGTPGGIGTIMSREADSLVAEIRKDPNKAGKLLSTSNLKSILDHAINTDGARLTDTQRASAHSEFKQRVAAGMVLNEQGDDEAKESFGKAAKLEDDLRNASGGLIGADKSAESYAKDVTHATSGYLKKYADSQRHFYNFSHLKEDEGIEKDFTESSNILAGAGLTDKASIQVMMSTGGSAEELLRIRNSRTSTTEERTAADKILHMDRKENSKLFDMAKDQRKRIVDITGGEGSDTTQFNFAVGEIAEVSANQISASRTQGAALATHDRFVEAGLMPAGSAMSGSRALDVLKDKARRSTATGGRQLAQELFGDKGLEAGSFDIVEGDFNELAQAKRRGFSQDKIDKLVEKIAQKKYLAAVENHKKTGDGPETGTSGGASSSTGDAGTDVSLQNLKEMREYNKQAFEALKTLTTTSQRTVDSMNNFISAVQSRVQPLDKTP